MVSFATLESRITNTVISRLANKTMTFNGTPITGVFDNRPEDVNFVESSQPEFVIKTSDIGSIQLNSQLIDGSITWVVNEIDKDDAGLTRLQLRLS